MSDAYCLFPIIFLILIIWLIKRVMEDREGA